MEIKNKPEFKFSVTPKAVDHTYFADWMIDELKDQYTFYCRKAADWGNFGDYDTARFYMVKASRIDTKIQKILTWDNAAQNSVIRWADRMFNERVM